MNAFTKATRKKAKLRLALTGPSGSGKTYGALLIASGLGGKIALIDTERGSASLYSDLVDFDVLELGAPYSPERFIEAVDMAEKAGYDTLVIDSISHEWNGSGGCLEINDAIAKSRYRGNTWSAWSDTTPRHRAFLDRLTQSQMHIIATMRSKTETAQNSKDGKTSVAKLGMKPEQRDGAEYEFTVVLDLVHDGHFATPSKDRTGLFMGKDPQPITKGTGGSLLDWLEKGEKPPGLPEYSDEALLKNLPVWQEMFSTGKLTPDDLIAKIETKAELSEAQKATIIAHGKWIEEAQVDNSEGGHEQWPA